MVFQGVSLERKSLERRKQIPGAQDPRAWFSKKFPWNASPSSAENKFRVRKSLEHGFPRSFPETQVLKRGKQIPGALVPRAWFSKKFPWNAIPSSAENKFRRTLRKRKVLTQKKSKILFFCVSFTFLLRVCLLFFCVFYKLDLLFFCVLLCRL